MPVPRLAENQNKDMMRAYIDALIQIIPNVGGTITTILAYHWPYARNTEIERKLNALCDAHNELEKALSKENPSLELPPRLAALAVLIARFLCEYGDHHLCDPIDTHALFETFSDIPKSEVEDAIAELIKQGFLTEISTLQRFQFLVRKPQLFFIFYPDVYGWAPAVDAAHIGELIVSKPGFDNSAELDKHLNWPRQRLNAALLFLITAIFEENHYHTELSAEYPATWFLPGPEERYEIGRLKQKIAGIPSSR